VFVRAEHQPADGRNRGRARGRGGSGSAPRGRSGGRAARRARPRLFRAGGFRATRIGEQGIGSGGVESDLKLVPRARTSRRCSAALCVTWDLARRAGSFEAVLGRRGGAGGVRRTSARTWAGWWSRERAGRAGSAPRGRPGVSASSARLFRAGAFRATRIGEQGIGSGGVESDLKLLPRARPSRRFSAALCVTWDLARRAGSFEAVLGRPGGAGGVRRTSARTRAGWWPRESAGRSGIGTSRAAGRLGELGLGSSVRARSGQRGSASRGSAAEASSHIPKLGPRAHLSKLFGGPVRHVGLGAKGRIFRGRSGAARRCRRCSSGPNIRPHTGGMVAAREGGMDRDRHLEPLPSRWPCAKVVRPDGSRMRP